MGPLTGLIIILGGVAIVSGILALWMNTKNGKKWLKSLDD